MCLAMMLVGVSSTTNRCQASHLPESSFPASPPKRSRLVIWASVFLMGIVGCQSPRVKMEFELLHREMREMEDYIYSLEAELDEKSSQLSELQSTSSTNIDSDSNPGDFAQEDFEDDQLQAPKVELDDSEAGSFEVIEPPEDLLPAIPPPDELEEFQKPQELSQASLTSLDSESLDTDSNPPGGDVVDTHVTHVVLNNRLTAGHNFDGAPGDDGIRVVLEPRNSKGQVLPLQGAVSLVLLDPQLKEEEPRIARWDFDSDQVSQFIVETGSDQGIHLELPWKQRIPKHSHLHLFVRYETADGRRLVADEQIRLDGRGGSANPWTPANESSRLARRDIGDDSPHVRGNILSEVPVGKTAHPSQQAPDSDSKVAGVNESGEPGSTRLVPPLSPMNKTLDDTSQRARLKIRRPRWKPYR